ncbi:MAG: hypothetical protein ACR2KB_03130 [Chitinophagaceae bacterium]
MYPGNYTLYVETYTYNTSDYWEVQIQCNQQTPIDLSYLRPQSSTTISTSSNLYTNFLSTSNIFQKYPSLTITNQNIDLVTVADPNIEAMVISISGVGSSNTLVVFHNISSSQFIYFFMEFNFNSQAQQVSSNLYDDNNQFIYSTYQTSTYFDLILPSTNPATRIGGTCFGDCMDKQEANFESTFTGWLAWNMPPHSVIVQAAAAVNCLGCCQQWWNNKGC